jgi:large subunit ribosomal protein L10
MRPEKESIAQEVAEKVQGSVFVILADYRGLTVSQTDELRKQLWDADARIQVVKNRTLRRADEKLGADLKGPSAMVYGQGDVVQVAKVLRDFIKANKLPVIKVGSLEGAILSSDDIKSLAGLPGRQELLAHVVGTVAAPLSQMVGVLSQKVASLVYVLKAIQDKKEAA